MKIINENDSKNLIGPRLKNAREKSKLTQKQLSIKLETIGIYIDRASISKIEQQKRIVTDYELYAFSTILQVSLPWLMNIDRELWTESARRSP